MGFLSKLFGAEAEKTAKGLLNNLANEAKKNQNASPAPSSTDNYNQTNYQNNAETEADGPSGFSWGPKMPAEENQYNYGGSYIDYFREIFNSNFSEYRIEQVQEGSTTIFTFYRGNSKALMVELLSKKSGRYKIRKECRAAGVPYLRYYYNYHGWWNTKAYVIERTGKALNS